MLREFYQRIRPLGLWPREWKAGHEVEHRYDALRLIVALLWQLMTFLLPMLAVLKMWGSLVGVGIPWLVLTVLLWRDAQGAAGDEVDEAPAGEAGGRAAAASPATAGQDAEAR